MRYINLAIFLMLLPLASAAQDAVFKVDQLNAGLPESTADLDLLTPQSSIETFIFAAEDQDFDNAAHVLNLNDIDIPAQSSLGPELAEKLAAVIDRKVVISWQSLLERPDSLDAAAPSENAMAGQPRKSLLLAVLDLDDRAIALRLNRVQPDGGDAVWVFSRQSVQNINALFDRYGPTKLEKMMPSALRTSAFWGLAWWEVIGLPLVAILAGFLATLTWRTFEWLSNLRTDSVISAILRGTRLPATLAVIATVVAFTTGTIFVFSGFISNLLEPLIVISFVSAFMILAINIIDAFLASIVDVRIEELASPQEEDRRALATTVSALRRFAVIIAVLLGAGITLTSAKIFQTLGFSLLAGAGALTLVVGLAAREVLGNILASMQISLNRSARVGDQLIYDGALCTVERIYFTFVQLKVWDETRMIVPVSKFVSDEFINRNLSQNQMLRHVTLKLDPKVNVTALRDHFVQWAKNDDRIGDMDKSEAMVTGQGEFGIDVRFVLPVPDPRDGWAVECDMREELMGCVATLEDEGGIDVAPHLGTERHGETNDSAAVDAV